MSLTGSMPLYIMSGFLLLLAEGGRCLDAQAASTASLAWQQVIAGATVASLSDFSFGSVDRRPDSATSAAGSLEWSTAGFLISGSPHQSLSIVLPAKGEVRLRRGVGGTPRTEILVEAFSDLSGEGLLPSDGRLVFHVAAVRPVILPDQLVGVYQGMILVTAVY